MFTLILTSILMPIASVVGFWITTKGRIGWVYLLATEGIWWYYTISLGRWELYPNTVLFTVFFIYMIVRCYYKTKALPEPEYMI